MIGRKESVRPLQAIRWARNQVTERGLKPLEAHVLLLLATYVNEDGEAWPSIRTLALQAGVKPTKAGTSSAVSKAIRGLEEAGLIWSRQGGSGRPAIRELLFDPSAEKDGSRDVSNPSARMADEENDGGAQALAILPDGCVPSAQEDAKSQGRASSTEGANAFQDQISKSQGMPSADADGMDHDDSEQVRAAIISSLDEARRRRDAA